MATTDQRELSVWSRIVPQPRNVVETAGALPTGAGMCLRAEKGELLITAAAAAAAVQRIVGVEWTVAPAPEAGRTPVVLQVDEENFGGRKRGPAGPVAGTYTLQVTPDQVKIVGGDPEGIAAGLATLAQAMLHAQGGPLPCVEIEDAPAHPWRGFMLDMARHFFPIQSAYRFLDLLWFFRFNRYQLHLTDDQGWRVPIAGYPLLTEVGAWRDDGTSEDGRYGGFYSVQELQDLDAAAAALGVVIVPEIDLPGHASAALTAYPELGCTGSAPGVETRWGIFDAVIRPVGKDTQQFMDTVFGEVAHIFSGPYIHVGGDEVVTTTWNTCDQCRRYLEEQELHHVDDLFQTIVRTMTESVIAHGKRPLVWDEASRLNLPGETIIVNWREPRFAAAALERGYDIVLAPQGRRAYLDHKPSSDPLDAGRLGVCTPRDSASFEPRRYVDEAVHAAGAEEMRGLGGNGSPGGNTSADREGAVLGGQANLWTEAIPYHPYAEYMALVRLVAISQGLWHGQPGTDRWDDEFRDRLEGVRRALFTRGYTVYAGPLE